MVKVDYLLITSTYYKRDILNLLFLPEKVQYRFRYREQWVPSSVLQNPSAFQNKTVLIAYFYGLPPQESYNDFVPIRLATIEEISSLGDILYLRYVTGKIASGDSGTNLGKTLHDAVLDFATPLLGSHHLSKYIIPTTNLDVTPQDDQLKGWTGVVKALGSLDVFRFCNFLKLVEISDQKRKALTPKRIIGRSRHRFPPLKSRPQVLGYQLKSGQSYKMDLLQTIPVDKLKLASPIEVALKASGSIMPLGSERIVSSYDKLELNLSVIDTFQDRYVDILVSSGPGKGRGSGDNSDFDIESPEAIVHCKIRQSLLTVPISLIGAGVLLTSLSDWIASEVSLVSAFTGSGTILGIMIKAIGAAMVAIEVARIARKT